MGLTLSRLVLAEQYGEFCKDSHMSALKTQTGLQQADNLLKVPSTFIHLNESSKFLLLKVLCICFIQSRINTHCMDNDMQTTNLSQAELRFLYARGMDLLPDPDTSSETAMGGENKTPTVYCQPSGRSPRRLGFRRGRSKS